MYKDFEVVGVKSWDGEMKGLKIENNSLKYHIQTGNILLLREKFMQFILKERHKKKKQPSMIKIELYYLV